MNDKPPKKGDHETDLEQRLRQLGRRIEVSESPILEDLAHRARLNTGTETPNNLKPLPESLLAEMREDKAADVAMKTDGSEKTEVGTLIEVGSDAEEESDAAFNAFPGFDMSRRGDKL